jgi:putative membrane protein
MRTKLTLALLASMALVATPLSFGQSTDRKDASAKSEPKKNALPRQDRRYFRALAQGNMAEVEAGEIAQKNASSEEVKKFARQMVEDHGKMLEEQQGLAKKKGVAMPKDAGKEHRTQLRKLAKLSGEQFDRAYMDDMVKDHEKDLKLVQEAQKNAKDPELKAAVEKAAPVIQKHLEMAKQISSRR